VGGRHGGDTQVELLAADPVHDASVLRQAALGNIQPRHDLDAGNDRAGRARRRGFDFLQHAVDTVTHLEPVLERLDVNIGGARLDRALEDQVDQANDRGLGSQVAQVLDVFLVLAAFTAQAFGNLAHGRLAAAEIALDGVVDFRRNPDPGDDLTPGRHLQRL